MRGMWRIGAAMAAMGAALAGAAGTPAKGTTSETYQYVALGGVYVAGPDFAARAVRDATGVGTAPMGNVDFVSSASEFTLMIDDVAAADGRTLAVALLQRTPAGEQTSGTVCVPVRSTTVFGTAPGNIVSASIWDAATPQGCTARASTGTIVVER